MRDRSNLGIFRRFAKGELCCKCGHNQKLHIDRGKGKRDRCKCGCGSFKGFKTFIFEKRRNAIKPNRHKK